MHCFHSAQRFTAVWSKSKEKPKICRGGETVQHHMAKKTACVELAERECVFMSTHTHTYIHTHTHTQGVEACDQTGGRLLLLLSELCFCLSVGVCVCVWIKHANMLCGLRREVKNTFGENCSLLDSGLVDYSRSFSAIRERCVWDSALGNLTDVTWSSAKVFLSRCLVWSCYLDWIDFSSVS